MFHSLSRVVTDCRMFTNRIILFNTQENIEEFETDYKAMYGKTGYYNLLKAANKEVYRAPGTPKKEGYIQEYRIFNTGL